MSFDQNKISTYIASDAKIWQDSSREFNTKNKTIIGKIVLQSLIADIVIKLNIDVNIFLNKKSILFFENSYPPNILLYNKEKTSLHDYVKFMETFFNNFRNFAVYFDSLPSKLNNIDIDNLLE